MHAKTDFFSDQFRKIIIRYERIGYTLNVMRQSACLVFNAFTVNCTHVGRTSNSKAIILGGWGGAFSSVAWFTGARLAIFFCFRFPLVLFVTCCPSMF